MEAEDTWFFVCDQAHRVHHLCSRECLVQWVDKLGPPESLTRLKAGGFHIITPSRRE